MKNNQECGEADARSATPGAHRCVRVLLSCSLVSGNRRRPLFSSGPISRPLTAAENWVIVLPSTRCAAVGISLDSMFQPHYTTRVASSVGSGGEHVPLTQPGG